MYNSRVSERHMDFMSLSAYERMEGQCLTPFQNLIGRMVKKLSSEACYLNNPEQNSTLRKATDTFLKLNE